MGQNNSEQNKNTTDLSWQIKQTNQQIKRYLDAQLSPLLGEGDSSMTAIHGMVLYYLSSQPPGAEVFQRDLERKFHVGRSTVTGVLQLMEQNGLVLRQSVPQDARLKKLVLTPKAIEIEQEICRRIGEMEQTLRRNITPQELETTVRVLKQIQTNLDQQPLEESEATG